MPNVMLAEYFDSKGISLGLDFNELKDKDTEVIFSAFLELSEEQQATIEADFQNINAIACEGGIHALVDEANFHLYDGFTQEVSAIDGFHAKAMWAFLEKHDYWRGASMFFHADNVSASYWKKRNDLPSAPPYVETDDIEKLAKSISDYFYAKEGRGRNCKVEPYRRNNKEYFFAYPEDFGQSGVEWVSNNLKTLSRHPAFEIIFVYSEDEGSLDIYAPRNTKAVPELQKLFAENILRLGTLPDGKIDKRVYDLKPLEDANFDFQAEPEAGIASVVVTRLRLTLKHGDRKRITLEANTTKNPIAVYDLLDELKPPPHYITQIGLKVTFESIQGQRAKTRSFNITYPNSCALNYDGNDLKIRNMLAKSGIEPQALKDAI